MSATPAGETRETVDCGGCGLVQFRPTSGKCRRCLRPMLRGGVETAVVIYATTPTKRSDRVELLEPLLKAMAIDAAVHAVEVYPHTTKAAKALGITHQRLKALLGKAGDTQDRRYTKRQQKESVCDR